MSFPPPLHALKQRILGEEPSLQYVRYLFPVAISTILFFPLLSGDYQYPIAEYELYKSFMINFIETLKGGELPVWNEYVGSGHPAMYFGHYPINQNTLFYMVFGFNDFTYLFTKLISTVILLAGFTYACQFIRVDFLTALAGALVYFSVNFVIRIIVAETVGNLFPLYPILAILLVYQVWQEKYDLKHIAAFSILYIFWLLGGNVTYVHMHIFMLAVVFWTSVVVFHPGSLRNRHLLRHLRSFSLLLVLPLGAVAYQYYFVTLIIFDSNRLKEGLLISPFLPLVWKQLLTSFLSSSYVMVGMVLALAYAALRTLASKYPFLASSRIRISLSLFIIVTISLYIVVRGTGTGLFRENVLPRGELEQADDIQSAHVQSAVAEIVPGGRFGNCLKVTTSENSSGYISFSSPLQVGKKYRFSCFFRNATSPNSQVKVGSSVDGTDLYYSGVLSGGDWGKCEVQFRAKARTAFITLVNLSSNKGDTVLFDSITLNPVSLPILSDYSTILESWTFACAFLAFLMFHLALGIRSPFYRIRLTDLVLLFVHISLLSHYFYSPENIIGDVNGYDYDLFLELGPAFQFIFCLSILFAVEEHRKSPIARVMVISLVVLYLIRSHLTIPIIRFSGIVWYATRDGSIFSMFFAVLFMLGTRNLIKHAEVLVKAFSTSNFFSYLHLTPNVVRYGFLVFLIGLITVDSHHKLYQGTSHRFIYPNRSQLAKTGMERWILDGRREVAALRQRLIGLSRNNHGFYRMFTPENSYLYLSGTLQSEKLSEAVIYDSSISRTLQDFYSGVVLMPDPRTKGEFTDVLPYFLFTRHVHEGLGLDHRDINYEDFFLFSPRNHFRRLRQDRLEFLWDLMQVKYLVVGPEFGAFLEGFPDYPLKYKLLDKYAGLRLNLYEIKRDACKSRLAFLPIRHAQDAERVLGNLNAKSVVKLKEAFHLLLFPSDVSGFELLSESRGGPNREYVVRANRQGFVIEFESWNRGWSAKVNGDRAPVDKAFGLFRCTKIEEGESRIEVSYSPRYFNLLFWVSISALALYVSILFLGHFREKRRGLECKRRGVHGGADRKERF
jgi:hypothetical protein